MQHIKWKFPTNTIKTNNIIKCDQVCPRNFLKKKKKNFPEQCRQITSYSECKQRGCFAIFSAVSMSRNPAATILLSTLAWEDLPLRESQMLDFPERLDIRTTKDRMHMFLHTNDKWENILQAMQIANRAFLKPK